MNPQSDIVTYSIQHINCDIYCLISLSSASESMWAVFTCIHSLLFIGQREPKQIKYQDTARSVVSTVAQIKQNTLSTVYMHSSNKVTQRNQVTQVTKELIYMHCSNTDCLCASHIQTHLVAVNAVVVLQSKGLGQRDAHWETYNRHSEGVCHQIG